MTTEIKVVPTANRKAWVAVEDAGAVERILFRSALKSSEVDTLIRDLDLDFVCPWCNSTVEGDSPDNHAIQHNDHICCGVATIGDGGRHPGDIWRRA